MRIEIGCTADGCKRTGLANVVSNAFDEPALGLFLPPGWKSESGESGPENATYIAVDFACPVHAVWETGEEESDAGG